MTSSQFPQEIELKCLPVTAVDLSLFAASSGDHNPMHLDVDAARAAGFDRPVVHGMLTMAYVGRMFTEQFGAASIRALRTQFTGVALRGDALILRASLLGIEEGLGRYTVRAETAAGTEVAHGEARVSRPRDHETPG
ncbi:MAG: uncharacterized protein JWQ07_1097 [Ramlibacter sp.]|nr:uncharacterized protein [Ramlibacter sp.]